MRTYDNGCFFTVAFNKVDSYEFKTRWPCSTVRGAGSFQFQKSNGDLVDVTGSAAKGDGPDWAAFADDCKAFGLTHLPFDWEGEARGQAFLTERVLPKLLTLGFDKAYVYTNSPHLCLGLSGDCEVDVWWADRVAGRPGKPYLSLSGERRVRHLSVRSIGTVIAWAVAERAARGGAA